MSNIVKESCNHSLASFSHGRTKCGICWRNPPIRRANRVEHEVTPGVKPCTKSGTHRKDAARGIVSRIAIAGNTLKPDIAPRMDFPFKEALKKVANKGRFGFATNQGGQ